MRPMHSLITLRWNQGGRNVSSATIQRGGKMTKSALARPGTSLGEGRTGMIVGDGADRIESAKIIFAGRQIAVPGDDVERAVIEIRDPERSEMLLDQGE